MVLTTPKALVQSVGCLPKPDSRVTPRLPPLPPSRHLPLAYLPTSHLPSSPRAITPPLSTNLLPSSFHQPTPLSVFIPSSDAMIESSITVAPIRNITVSPVPKYHGLPRSINRRRRRAGPVVGGLSIHQVTFRASTNTNSAARRAPRIDSTPARNRAIVPTGWISP